MKNLILILLLSFSSSSCVFVAKTLYGIKKPKIENEVSLNRYIKRNKMTHKDNYTVDYENYLPMYSIIENQLPKVLIFNKKGNALTYKEKNGCGGVVYEFIKKLDAKGTYESVIDTMIEMKTIVTKLHNLKGTLTSINYSHETDFYVFVYWAKYLGTLNKNVKEIEKLAKENSKANIRIMKVNMDQQEYWEEENLNEMPSFKVVKK